LGYNLNVTKITLVEMIAAGTKDCIMLHL